MELEKTLKDLQAQNAQFQQMLLTLANGQEDLKTLFTKESKKKTKKKVVTLKIGRKFKGPSQLAQKEDISSEEEDNQEE